MHAASLLTRSRLLLAFLAVLVTVGAGLGTIPLRAASQQSSPPSPQFAYPAFSDLWQRTDGPVAAGQVKRSWLWGPQPGQSADEQFLGTPGGSRKVQYFDKGRMELDASQPITSSWRVASGLLVTEMLEGRIQMGDASFSSLPPSRDVVAGDAGIALNPKYSDFTALAAKSATDSTGSPVNAVLSSADLAFEHPTNVSYTKYIQQTGHNIPDVFMTYLVTLTGAAGPGTDWVYFMGYPVTEAYWCDVTVGGKRYMTLVQLYQRRTLSYIAEMPVGWQVQMGNVGAQYYSWRYGQGGGVAPIGPVVTATLTPTPPQAARGAFVTISAGQFMYAGQVVKLKGTNYWQSNAPFTGTWGSWDGPQVLADLKRAHDLGVNTVRIGIPYDHRDTRDVVWDSDPKMRKVSSWIQDEMTQLLQIASVEGMKVIFVLFDWNDDQPPAGSEGEIQNLAYLQGVVGPFANDDRVLAWDLHNEPDNYLSWTDTKDRVLEWLGRMSTAVRTIDHNHPLTVGVGNYSSLWYKSASGVAILDLVDFASFHSYDAGSLPTQVAAIRAHTTKPVLLEEMGWPTSPGAQTEPQGVHYDEATQTFLYTTMLNDAKQLNIAGVMQWTLLDFGIGTTSKLANYEEHFGLFRLDGSAKPALAVFRDEYTARDLPSRTQSNMPLDTADTHKP